MIENVYIIWGFNEYGDEMKYETGLDGEPYIESIYDDEATAQNEALKLNRKYKLNEDNDILFYVETIPLKSSMQKTIGKMFDENIQLTKSLQQKEEIIEEAITYLQGCYEMSMYTKSVTLEKENVDYLLDILNKYKNEDKEDS